MAQKVVQLTKVIVFLHTRADGHEARCTSLKEACAEEVRQVGAAAAVHVEEQRRRVEAALGRHERWLRELDQQGGDLRSAARDTVQEATRATASREAKTKAQFESKLASREELLDAMRQQAKSLTCDYDVAVGRARNDEQWLELQLAAEAARERVRLDERFEAEAAELRAAHGQEVEQLRACHAELAESLREEDAARRSELLAGAEEELVAAVGQQEEAFASERRNLEETLASCREELAGVSSTASTAKDESAVRQRFLDEMSKELQEHKRRARTLSAESDRAHERKLRAESEARDLQRQRSLLERSLQPPSSGGAGEGTPQTERALASLSEDVRRAESRLGELRGELSAKDRAVEERRAMLDERARRAEQLRLELQEERQRADALQRVLLRLEQT